MLWILGVSTAVGAVIGALTGPLCDVPSKKAAQVGALVGVGGGLLVAGGAAAIAAVAAGNLITNSNLVTSPSVLGAIPLVSTPSGQHYIRSGTR